jgi:hypothetical protein
MISISLLNTDGYPLSAQVRKGLFSTVSQAIVEMFIQTYADQQIVTRHYMILKDIYSSGLRLGGVIADYPFLSPVAGGRVPITSQCLIVEYSGGEVRAVDFSDRNYDILRLTSLSCCTGAMVFQYDPKQIYDASQKMNLELESQLHTRPEKLFPGYYGLRGYYTPESDDVRQFSKYVTGQDPRLYFRGLKTNSIRECLDELSKFPETEIYTSRIKTEAYFAESSPHKILLGLPGLGDVCFRDFEAFALKIPLLRTEYAVTFAEPLIPDYHYLKVSVRDNGNATMLAEDIMSRYHEVIQDESLLESISENAYEYYRNFGSYEAVSRKCFEFLQPTT